MHPEVVHLQRLQMCAVLGSYVYLVRAPASIQKTMAGRLSDPQAEVNDVSRH